MGAFLEALGLRSIRIKSPLVMGTFPQRFCPLSNRTSGQWLPQWISIAHLKGYQLYAQTHLSTEPWPLVPMLEELLPREGSTCFWYLPLEFGMHFPREEVVINNQCAPRPTIGSLFNTNLKPSKL